MKKLLLFTNVITLSILALVWYTGCNPTSQSLCTTACYPFTDTSAFAGLDKQFAKMLVADYRDNQWSVYGHKLLSQGDTMSDARSCWFSLYKLKRFIHQIENSMCACNAGQDPKPMLGIRFYYGTYPNSTLWPQYGLNGHVPGNHERHHTLMLVPTYFNTSVQMHVDFDPARVAQGTCQPVPLSQVFSTQLKVPVMWVTDDGSGDPSNTSMDNHGSLWPPPDDSRFIAPYNIPTANPPLNTTGIQCTGATFGNVVDGVMVCPQNY